MPYTYKWDRTPTWAPADYRSTIHSPTEIRRGLQTWLLTPETPPDTHPWRDHIDMDAFPDPDMNSYRVIAMQHGIHSASGDVAWDLEAYSPEQDQYLTISYAD